MIIMLISWSYKASSVILQRAVRNPISTRLTTVSVKQWKSFQVLNLSKNCYEKENLICDSKNRLNRKESSVSSKVFTSYFSFFINRFYHDQGEMFVNYILLSLLINIFLEIFTVLMQTVKN